MPVTFFYAAIFTAMSASKRQGWPGRYPPQEVDPDSGPEASENHNECPKHHPRKKQKAYGSKDSQSRMMGSNKLKEIAVASLTS